MKISVRIAGQVGRLGAGAARRLSDAARQATEQRRDDAARRTDRGNERGEVSHVIRKPGLAGFDIPDAQH